MKNIHKEFDFAKVSQKGDEQTSPAEEYAEIFFTEKGSVHFTAIDDRANLS